MMNPSAGGDAMGLKKFVTETELEQQKQKRQEEWEKKRTPDQPLECPEEEFDGRSLYERLEDQKRQKDEETEEKFKLGNQVRGLDEDETKFLDLVSQRQIEINKERRNEERDILQQIKQSTSAPVVLDSGQSTTPKPTATVAPFGSSQSKSQSALLAGAIKRKSTDNRTDEKKTKLSEEEPDRTNSENKSADSTTSRPQIARVIGILPGIGQYTVDSSASDSSSCDSDSESEPMILPVTKPGLLEVLIHRK